MHLGFVHFSEYVFYLHKMQINEKNKLGNKVGYKID